jgi:hypothetical protein
VGVAGLIAASFVVAFGGTKTIGAGFSATIFTGAVFTGGIVAAAVFVCAGFTIGGLTAAAEVCFAVEFTAGVFVCGGAFSAFGFDVAGAVAGFAVGILAVGVADSTGLAVPGTGVMTRGEPVAGCAADSGALAFGDDSAFDSSVAGLRADAFASAFGAGVDVLLVRSGGGTTAGDVGVASSLATSSSDLGG